MPYPRLLHPVSISIQQILLDTTVFDEDMREPVQQAARAATYVVVPGQVSWGTAGGFAGRAADHNYFKQPQGAQETSDGYVLFRYADLAAADITLKREDRFARLGTIDVDVYVTRLMHMGHYPGSNGPTLVRAYFSDRQPAKQTRG